MLWRGIRVKWIGQTRLPLRQRVRLPTGEYKAPWTVQIINAHTNTRLFLSLLSFSLSPFLLPPVSSPFHRFLAALLFRAPPIPFPASISNVEPASADTLLPDFYRTSDRGCLAEMSVGHRRRAFQRGADRQSPSPAHSGSMRCRRVATTDHASLRPKKGFSPEGKWLFTTPKHLAVVDRYSKHPDFVDYHPRCRPRATALRRS